MAESQDLLLEERVVQTVALTHSLDLLTPATDAAAVQEQEPTCQRDREDQSEQGPALARKNRAQDRHQRAQTARHDDVPVEPAARLQRAQSQVNGLQQDRGILG